MEGNMYVNATQIGKIYGKLPANFHNTQAIKDLIEEIESNYCDYINYGIPTIVAKAGD